MRASPLLLAVAAAALVAGCGGGEGGSAEAEIRSMIAAATVSDDPASCRRYATMAFLEQRSGLEGAAAVRDCEESDSESPPDRVIPRQIEVDGERARTTIAFEGGLLGGQAIAYALVEEDGRWKYDEALGFVVFDREQILLEWGRVLYGNAADLGEADAVTCLLERVRRLDDPELEDLLLEPDREQFLQLGRACEPRSDSV